MLYYWVVGFEKVLADFQFSVFNQLQKKVSKKLNNFQHEGKPYCNRCYGALFGPKGYGHGGTESHTFLQGTTGN